MASFNFGGDGTVSAVTLTGAGSPEGSVTANPGSLYFNQTDSTLWIKTTGTGNTGWVQTAGAALTNGWIDDGVVVRLQTSTDSLGVGTSSPAAGMQISKSLLLGTTVLGDFPTGGAIGAAAVVDGASSASVAQTTAGQTLTIPSPTNTTVGRLFYVLNVGTASFFMLGRTVGAGEHLAVAWNGTAWSPIPAASTAFSVSSVQTAAFAASFSQLVRVDTTASGFTVTLPAITPQSTGTSIVVKKVSSDTRPVTIVRSGTNLIDGETSIELATPRGSVQLVSDGTSNWLAV